MDVLLRHTILGEWLLYAGPSHLSHTEEVNVASLKQLNTLRELQREQSNSDETTRLLTDAEGHYHRETRVVDWYGDGDLDVSCVPSERHESI